MMMCRDVVDADAESLTGLQKLAYRFHMKVCPACQAHHKQVETTVATLAAIPKDEQPSEDAREKALAAFRKNKKEPV